MAKLENPVKIENSKGRLKNAFLSVAAVGAKAFYDAVAVSGRRQGFLASAEAATTQGHVVADKINAHKTPKPS